MTAHPWLVGKVEKGLKNSQQRERNQDDEAPTVKASVLRGIAGHVGP